MNCPVVAVPPPVLFTVASRLILAVVANEAVNIAETVTSELELIEHVPVPEQPAPDQPMKVDPVVAVAVSVADIGESYEEEQVLPQ